MGRQMSKRNEAEAHWEAKALGVLERLYDARPKSPSTPSSMPVEERIRIWNQWVDAYVFWHDAAQEDVRSIFEKMPRISSRALKWVENEASALFRHEFSPELDEIGALSIDLRLLERLHGNQDENLNSAIEERARARARVAARRRDEPGDI